MPKVYACKSCPKTFPKPSLLSRHELTHTGEKPYQCNFCGNQFAQKAGLTVHIRTHTGEKPFACQYCNRRFAQKVTRDIHLNTHTREKPYLCLNCDERFAHQATFENHTCGATRSFHCPVCSEKGFSSDKTYKAHMLKEHPDYGERELSISPPRQPQASTRYARSPSEVSINQQTIPGVGTIYAVTHTMTSLATGIVTTAARISDPSGETVVFTQTRTTARPATATSTATGPGTSAASAQPYPVEIAAVAQQAPEPSFFVPENPQEVPIMDFDDLSNAWVGDKFPW